MAGKGITKLLGNNEVLLYSVIICRTLRFFVFTELLCVVI